MTKIHPQTATYILNLTTEALEEAATRWGRTKEGLFARAHLAEREKVRAEAAALSAWRSSSLAAVGLTGKEGVRVECPRVGRDFRFAVSHLRLDEAWVRLDTGEKEDREPVLHQLLSLDKGIIAAAAWKEQDGPGRPYWVAWKVRPKTKA